MSENNFELEKEYLEEETSPEEKEAIFEDFNEKESVIQKETEGFLMKLVPEKFKKEAVSLLAALSIVTSAASTFAEGFKGEEIDKEKLLPENQIEEVVKENVSPQELFEKMVASDKKDEFAPFDWEKIAHKIQISIGGEFEDIPEYKTKAVKNDRYERLLDNEGIVIPDFYKRKDISREEYEKLNDSNPYKNISWEEYVSAIDMEVQSISQANSSLEFFTKLNSEKEKLSDGQKALILQSLGNALHKNYNFDMLENNIFVETSDDVMFQSIKELLTTGKSTESDMCGGIGVYLVNSAESLGVEAWLQSGSVRGGGNHVWPGMILNDNGKKQIVFLDYDTLIPTGTLDYRDALGIAERYHRSITTLNSFVGNENEVLFPVESRAQEVIKKAAGIEETAERLEGELSRGKIKKEKGLEINLGLEAKEIKITDDYFGVAYFNFQDSNSNPYQSLEDLSALRYGLNLKGERFGLEAGATVVHMNIKDLYNASVTQSEIIGRLTADYIDSHKLTKGEYGQIILNLGATFQELTKFIDGNINMEEGGKGTMEIAPGMRLIYIDPAETGKFYIGARGMFRGQRNDFQNQDPIIKEVARTLTIGTEIKVNEAQILNLEATGSNLDWGKKIKIKGGIASKELKGGLEYEKTESEYERFIPSSEKIGAEVDYKGGPKWMIKILGSKTTEEYAGDKKQDAYGGEVKLIIFLW